VGARHLLTGVFFVVWKTVIATVAIRGVYLSCVSRIQMHICCLIVTVLFFVVFRAGQRRVLGGGSVISMGIPSAHASSCSSYLSQRASFPPSASVLVPLVSHFVYASAGALGQINQLGNLHAGFVLLLQCLSGFCLRLILSYCEIMSANVVGAGGLSCGATRFLRGQSWYWFAVALHK